MKSVQLSILQDTSDAHLTEDAVWAGVYEHHAVLAIADGAPQRLRPVKSMQPLLEKYSEAFGEGVTPSGVASRLLCQTVAELANSALSLTDMVLQANATLADDLTTLYGDLSAAAMLQKEPDLTILAEDPRNIRMILPASTYTVARIDWREQTLELAHGADSALIALYKNGSARQLTPDQMAQHDNQVKVSLLNNPDAPAEHPFFRVRHNRKASEINQFNALFHNFVGPNGELDVARGVSVVNGLAQIKDYMYTACLPLADIRALLLVTDGAVLPPESFKDAPAEERVKKMAKHIICHGLETYITFLRREERRIRETSLNPQQSHDDASLILLRFS